MGKNPVSTFQRTENFYPYREQDHDLSVVQPSVEMLQNFGGVDNRTRRCLSDFLFHGTRSFLSVTFFFFYETSILSVTSFFYGTRSFLSVTSFFTEPAVSYL
jgi:hypothetical protein